MSFLSLTEAETKHLGESLRLILIPEWIWFYEIDGEAAAFIVMLPDLNDAIRVMESSDLVAETLGEHVFDFFLRNKREEWSEYRRQVTRYELDRYLPIL